MREREAVESTGPLADQSSVDAIYARAKERAHRACEPFAAIASPPDPCFLINDNLEQIIRIIARCDRLGGGFIFKPRTSLEEMV